MKELDNADLTLVYLRNGYPHCIKHGAMNAVSPIIWRCIHTYCFEPEDLHLPVEQRRINENPCRAGCILINSRE